MSIVWKRDLGYAASAALLVLVSALSAGDLQAQEYPSRFIRFVSPQGPGQTPEILARIIEPEMSKALGQPMIVEAKPGAEGAIGLEYVAKQMPADGYNIAVVLVSGLVTLPLTQSNLRFDPQKDLYPFIGLVEGRFVLGSPSDSPWKSFKEFVAYAKANPNKLNYGSANSQVRLMTEAILRPLGLDLTYIPYPSFPPLLLALRAGDLQLTLVNESNAVSYGDKFRVLAVTGDTRLAAFPDAPTFAELGFPMIRGISYTLSVRAGTPKPIVDKLYSAASQAMQQPQVREKLTKLFWEIPQDNSAAAASRNLAEQTKLYTEIARSIGLVPQ